MYKETIADMKLLGTAPTEEIVVGCYNVPGDDGGGVFIYRTGTAPFIDEGIYFATALGGYYERPIPGDYVHVNWFGYIADPDGDDPLTECDDKCRLKKAFDAGAALVKRVVSDKTAYYVDDYLTIKGDVDFNGSTIYFSATSTGNLIEQIAEGDILNLNIDGTGITNCQNGLLVRANYPVTRMTRYIMRIENLLNVNDHEPCNGAVFVKNKGETNYPNSKYDISISCKNIEARGTSGPIGSNSGSSSGILFSMNGPGTDAQVIIRDLEIDGVGLKKDSLGICVFTNDYQIGGKGQFLIENVVVRNCQKRGIKVQAPNTTVRNATVYGEQTDTCFDTYSSDTQFIGCRVLNMIGTGFNTDFSDTLIRDCAITTSATAGCGSLIIAQPASERLMIDNLHITLNKGFSSATVPAIDIISAGFNYVRNIKFKSAEHGFFLNLSNTGKVHIDNVTVEGLSNGILIGNNAGEVKITNSYFDNASYCLTTLSGPGNASSIYAHNSTFISATTAVYLKSSTIAGRLYMDDCKVIGQNGILAFEGSRIYNTSIENITSTKAGIGIEVADGQIDGCRIKNYERGVEWTSSTLAEFTNNKLIANTNAFSPAITVTVPYISDGNVIIP